ncbi:hypothetical protein J4734_22510 [Klebsiella pneumoniae]|uniref:Uncharacterized protein n=1 Tax=Klebsiella pneumoniae TaxID=573 RepID=A0A939NS87_KLEPN|nr:hypothetical protein [Klebsiella pneumoniae]
MSGSPRDGNRSPDLKGNAPLPDAARVPSDRGDCDSPVFHSFGGILLLPPGRHGAAPTSAPHGK